MIGASTERSEIGILKVGQGTGVRPSGRASTERSEIGILKGCQFSHVPFLLFWLQLNDPRLGY